MTKSFPEQNSLWAYGENSVSIFLKIAFDPNINNHLTKFGQLGIGTKRSISVPKKVVFGAEFQGIRIRDVKCGGDTSAILSGLRFCK